MTKKNAEDSLPISARQRETRKLISIEKRSAQTLAFFLVASLWFQSWSILLGLILGGALAILNFRWLWRIMEKIFLDQRWVHAIQGLVRFIVLVLAVFLILRFTAVNPIAFVVGISTLIVGIFFEVIRESLKAERKGSA